MSSNDGGNVSVLVYRRVRVIVKRQRRVRTVMTFILGAGNTIVGSHAQHNYNIVGSRQVGRHVRSTQLSGDTI